MDKTTKKPWRFVYDEEMMDTHGDNIVGIISDGERFLFYLVVAEEEGKLEDCYIYCSLYDLFEGENEVCVYPWTPDNDSLLLDCLNSLENVWDYCGDDSPLRTLKFNKEK